MNNIISDPLQMKTSDDRLNKNLVPIQLRWRLI